jgi:predicted Rossmann fold flavoprotein
MKVGVIGGGAAGFFYAINFAINNPEAKITIFEQGKTVLNKVKISGGGRCNVTHACFDPRDLTKFYPRGEKELRGPFHKFACGDTIEWFEKRGVELKIEEDGRMFPTTNSSQTIIDCLESECKKYGIRISTSQKVTNLKLNSDNTWHVQFKERSENFDKLFIGTGSSTYFWNILAELGHNIIKPVPSLFTFNIKDRAIKDLPGISVPNAHIKVIDSKLESNGPLLITHWGLSGPGILKLSAWGANILNDKNYNFQIEVDWIPHIDSEEIIDQKELQKGKFIKDKNPFGLPSRLWFNMIVDSSFYTKRWADLSKSELLELTNKLKSRVFKVQGKSTFKNEFVTAGGVDLKEVNFKNFSSKLLPNLHMAGEVINVDAITGGFNFQAAWTGAWIAAQG